MNYVCVIAYDGTGYYGWQKTKTGPSVEGSFAEALYRITKQKPLIQAASRTDRGVHARGQVINFSIETTLLPQQLQHALNGVLPKTIRVKDCSIFCESFHPTITAHSKVYRYQVCLGRSQLPFHRKTSYHFIYPTKLALMREAASHFIGKKDFISFRNARKDLKNDTTCEIYSIDISEIGENRLEFSLHANRFLYKMARNLVGTLLYIGAEKLDIENISSLLEKKDRRLLGITAPAHGLCLHKVYYDEITT